MRMVFIWNAVEWKEYMKMSIICALHTIYIDVRCVCWDLRYRTAFISCVIH